LVLAACGAYEGSSDDPPEPSPAVTDTRDGGAADAGASSDASRPPAAAKVVFVTKATLRSGLGTLRERATTECTSDARAAGLPGATWLPWLSNGLDDAIDQLVEEGPWLVPRGDVVFADRAAVYSATLRHAVDQHADGALVAPGAKVWTGTRKDGRASAEAPTCFAWTNDQPGVGGLVGDTSRTDARWTDDSTAPCNASRQVICFQL
jgi:hypothetical protein